MIQTFKNNLKLTVLALLVVFAASVAATASSYAQTAAPAAPSASTNGTNISGNTKCGSNINGLEPGNCDANVAGSGTDIQDLIKTVINVFSVIVGAVSVIMIIVGGFRYITSAGDSNGVSGAKNTILYAIVGLIIVAFAQIIVQFVLQRAVSP